MSEVPCIRLDNLTDAQRRAYALAHNKTAELSEWDDELLDIELDELELTDIDMSDFGFELSDGGAETPEISEDNYDGEVPEEAKAKVGDLYRLGNHFLICGDCTDKSVIEKLMDGTKPDLLLTDPPYGIQIVSGGGYNRNGELEVSEAAAHSTSGRVGGGSVNTPKDNRISPEAVVPAKTYRQIIGDETTETARKCYEVAKDYTVNQIIFGGNYFTDFLPPSRCWIVWDKQNTGNFADAELAWTSFDKGVKLYHFMWNGLARQGNRKEEGITRVHPTQKPVGMIGEIINDFTEEGDTILDCFGGSGTTLIACEKLNRKCYMCELDPHYVDVIIDRWETFTGKKAELISEG